MSEKRYRAEVDAKGHLKIITDGETVLNDSYEVVDLMNNLNKEIVNLKGDVERLRYIIQALREENYKKFEQIKQLERELKQKNEDEKLYANEILELNKTKKEILNFKQLGGDY